MMGFLLLLKPTSRSILKGVIQTSTRMAFCAEEFIRLDSKKNLRHYEVRIDSDRRPFGRGRRINKLGGKILNPPALFLTSLIS